MSRLLKKINLFFLIIAILILGIILYMSREYLTYSISTSDYSFQGINAISVGQNGGIYAVDNAMKKVLVIDDNSKLTKCINGGNRDESFEYAVKICDDADGNIYISEIIYSVGGLLERERIIRFSDDERTILFDQDYTQYAKPPMGFGNVKELKCVDNTAYFVYKGDDAIVIYEIIGDNCMARNVIECDIDVLDAAFDNETDSLVVSSRQGDLYINYLNDLGWQKIARNNNMQLPNSITAINGELYSIDEINGVVVRNDITDAAHIGVPSEFINDGNSYSEITTGNDNKLLLSNDGSLTLLDLTDGNQKEISSVKIAFYHRILFTWILLILYLILLIIFAMRLVLEAMEYFYKSDDKASILRICMVALAAVLVSVSISYTSVNDIDGEIMNNERENMDYTMSIMKKYINPIKVRKLGQSLESYGSEEYEALRKPLDDTIDAAIDNGLEYYYILYTVNDEGIVFVADYERDYCSGEPYIEFGDDLYTEAVKTGEVQYDFSDISSYGAYISMLYPFKDEAGNVIAMLEIGKPYDQIMDKKNAIIKESVFSVICSSIVVTMLVLELLFAINFYDKQRKLKASEMDSTTVVPLRLIAFSIYLTDCMQDAFVALLCERLYNEASDVRLLSVMPEGVAIALPLSLQLLFAALASFGGGNVISKYGTKRVMSTGLIIQMAGMIVCALTSTSYIGILIGKIFIGIGQGTVYVATNTMAALTDNAENSNKAFSDVSAGILSGVSVGAGLGATLFSMGSYSMVYFFGAGVLLLVFFLSLSVKDFKGNIEENAKKDMKENAKKGAKKDTKKELASEKPMNTLRFLTSREVFAFLIFILTPFMIAISFRDYFFPLYAGENGISELRIGQIYLVCGIVTLYIGPVIAKWLLEKIGAKRSIMFASLTMGITIAVYLINPGINIVIFAVVLFSFVTSFAYTCQYSYFESIPQTKNFGEGRAMGVYSVFESLGQTFGPIYFGGILSLGNAMGLAVSAVFMAGLTVIFALFTIKKKGHRKEIKK